MAVNVEVIRRITTQARVEGEQQATAAFDRMRVKMGDLSASAEDAAKGMLSNENAVKRARRAYEDNFSTIEKLARLQKDLTVGVAAGRIEQGQANLIFGIAAEKLTGMADQMEKAAKANLANARATIQAREAQAAMNREMAASSQRNIGTNLGFREAPGAQARAEDFEAALAAADKLRAKYDQAFAAEQKLITATKEINDLQAAGVLQPEVAAAAIERENAAYQAQLNLLNGVTDAQNKIAMSAEAQAARQAKAWANLKGDGASMMAAGNAGRALGGLSSDGTVQLTSAAQALRTELVPLAAAEEQYAAAVMKADAALRSNVISEAERDAAVARASGTLLNQRNEINKATQAHERMAKGAGLNAYALTNLSYQVNDVATSLASGISPIQTFAQQGGQIFQILQSDQGGVRGGLKSIGDLIKGIATPGRLMFAGLATGAATAAYALYSYNAEQAKLRQSVSGIGRASGATVGSINALAPDAGRAAGVSTSEARAMAGTFAATGKIGQEMYAGLIKGAKDYATITGKDVADATKEFAEAFASPSEGALTLNKSLGFLNFTTLENIRAMEQSGDRLGAQRMLLEASASATAKASEKLGFFAKQWEDFKNTTSNEIGEIGSFINKGLGMEDAEARVKTLQGQLDFRASRKGSMGGLFDSLWGFDEDQIRQDLAKAKAEVAKAQAEGKKTALDQRGLEIGELVKGLNPGTESLNKMERSAANIRTYFRELGVDPFGPAKATMEGLERSAAQLKKDMESGGAAFADAIRAADFQKKTVAYAPSAAGVAQINEAAEVKKVAALRESLNDNDQGAYQKRIDAINKERDLLLETARMRTMNETSSGSGRYSIGVGQAPEKYRDLIYGASNATGVNADLLAAQIRRESSFNPNARSPVGAEGISQFMPATRRGMGDFNAFDPAQAIPKQAELMAQLLKQFNGNEVAALIGYNAGPRTAQRFLAGGSDTSTLPKETQEYIKAILTPPPNAESLVKAETERNAQLDLNRKNLEASTQFLGKNGQALEVQLGVNQRLTEEQQKGVTITDSYRASIQSAVAATASLAQQNKLLQYNRDNDFERQQMGRATADQPAYAKARGLFGDTTSEASKFVIQQEKLNDNLRVTRQLGGEAFSGFLTDISHGTNALTALTSALTRMFDKLLSAAGDKIFSGIFGSLLGGDSKAGGGFLSGIFGLPKFAKGGIANGPSILGEAGPEAAVPLPDGRRIPVDLGPASNSNNMRPIQVAIGDSYLDVKPAEGVTPGQLQEILKNERQENARTIGQQLSTWKENN
jgi:soluble lytic murein transglycosylase-like protein